MSIAKLQEAWDDRGASDIVEINKTVLREALLEIEAISFRASGLVTTLEDALESIRLHEQSAHARRDTAAELEWRARGDRIERELAA